MLDRNKQIVYMQKKNILDAGRRFFDELTFFTLAVVAASSILRDKNEKNEERKYEEKPNAFISKEIIVARLILFDMCVYKTAEISLKNGCQVFVCPLII